MAMSDRICLMNNGRIEQLGTPQDLYFRPRSVFVAEFLGESNILEARVAEPGDPARLDAAGLSIRARGAAAAKAGECVKLVLRPEHLRLLADGEAADNVAQGRMKEIVFVGGVTRCFVSLPGGLTLSVKQLSLGADAAPRAGDQVRVGWSLDSGVALPAGAERP